MDRYGFFREIACLAGKGDEKAGFEELVELAEFWRDNAPNDEERDKADETIGDIYGAKGEFEEEEESIERRAYYDERLA